jgi:hypothetical protein
MTPGHTALAGRLYWLGFVCFFVLLHLLFGFIKHKTSKILESQEHITM